MRKLASMRGHTFRTPRSLLALAASAVSVETVRPDGARQAFAFAERGGFLESIEEIPEPHAFKARVTQAGTEHPEGFTPEAEQ